MAGCSDNHIVKVTVDAITEFGIGERNIVLTSNSYDNTTCNLKWVTNEVYKKITVVTSDTIPDLTLKLVATNTRGGSAATEVTLSTAAVNFITDISTTSGDCDLRYAVESTTCQEYRADPHPLTLTYTIVDIC